MTKESKNKGMANKISNLNFENKMPKVVSPKLEFKLTHWIKPTSLKLKFSSIQHQHCLVHKNKTDKTEHLRGST